MNKNWKEMLYSSYVSTGQASRNLETKPFLKSSDFIYFNTVLRPLLPANRNCRILDLGCGHGCLIHCIKEWGYTNVSGVDTSAEQVALAHDYGVKEVQHGDLFEVLSLEHESIDVIFLMDVIEHLTRQEIFDLLSSIGKRMIAKGLLVLHMPNALGIFGNSIRYGDLTHELAFTPKSIQQCLRANGFDDIRVYEDKPIPHGMASFCRRVVWELGSFPFRVLYAAESGMFPSALSQNMLVTATTVP